MLPKRNLMVLKINVGIDCEQTYAQPIPTF